MIYEENNLLETQKSKFQNNLKTTENKTMDIPIHHPIQHGSM